MMEFCIRHLWHCLAKEAFIILFRSLSQKSEFTASALLVGANKIVAAESAERTPAKQREPASKNKLAICDYILESLNHNPLNFFLFELSY
jgi:hypothetical protein